MWSLSQPFSSGGGLLIFWRTERFLRMIADGAKIATGSAGRV